MTTIMNEFTEISVKHLTLTLGSRIWRSWYRLRFAAARPFKLAARSIKKTINRPVLITPKYE